MKPIIDVIQKRRAYRAFDVNRPVPKETIENLIKAAHLAPSCMNNQPWRFVAATEAGVLEKVKETLPKSNGWIRGAAAIIAVFSKRDLDCMLSDNRDYFLFGCGMAVGNLMAQATEEDLIAHPVAGYDPEKVKSILGIPAEYILITLVNVGYRGTELGLLTDKQKASEQAPRDRKPIGEVLFWNSFAGGGN